MSKRRDPNPEFDLFIPALGDLPLKDQREVMERPFFSLQKRKRLKPIEYRSPDGDAWVRVQAIPDYGMATICCPKNVLAVSDRQHAEVCDQDARRAAGKLGRRILPPSRSSSR